jgi:hypothetical protein
MTSPITSEVEPNEYPLLADSYKTKKKKGRPRHRRWLWRIGGSIVVLLLIGFGFLVLFSPVEEVFPTIRYWLPIEAATYDAQTLWVNPLPIERPIHSVPTHYNGVNPLCVEFVNGTDIANKFVPGAEEADPRLVAYVNRDIDLATVNIAVDGRRVVFPPPNMFFRSFYAMDYPVWESEIDGLPFVPVEPSPRDNSDEIVGRVIVYTDNRICFSPQSRLTPGLHVATLRIQSHDRSGLYTHQWAFLTEVGSQSTHEADR